MSEIQKDTKIIAVKIELHLQQPEGGMFFRSGKGRDLIEAVEKMLLKRGSTNINFRNLVWEQVKQFALYLGRGAKREKQKIEKTDPNSPSA